MKLTTLSSMIALSLGGFSSVANADWGTPLYTPYVTP